MQHGKHRLSLKGKFVLEHFRKGEKIAEYDIFNGITNEGLNEILDVMFHGSAATATWYIGLIDESGYTGVAAGDVMNSHAGWTELQAYDEATRVAWDEAAAASQAIASSTSSDFTMNATETVKGIFVTSVNTKGGTTGILWSTALNASDINVVDDDVLKISYTVNAA